MNAVYFWIAKRPIAYIHYRFFFSAEDADVFENSSKIVDD